MNQHHYRHLLMMTIFSFVSVYVLMYAMVNTFDNRSGIRARAGAGVGRGLFLLTGEQLLNERDDATRMTSSAPVRSSLGPGTSSHF